MILAQWQRQVAGKSSNTPLHIVDLLTANPFISATGVAGELGVAFTTAQRAIELQERMEIAKLTTEAERDRIYYALRLLGVAQCSFSTLGMRSDSSLWALRDLLMVSNNSF